MWPKSLEELRKHCRKKLASWNNRETWNCPTCYLTHRELFDFCGKNVKGKSLKMSVEKLFSEIRKEKLEKLLA